MGGRGNLGWDFAGEERLEWVEGGLVDFEGVKDFGVFFWV